MDYKMKETGKRIAKLRKAYGLTQMQTAEKLNISLDHYRGIETGRRGGSIELLIDIASMFEVSLDYLFLGRDRDGMEIKKQLTILVEKLKEFDA